MLWRGFRRRSARAQRTAGAISEVRCVAVCPCLCVCVSSCANAAFDGGGGRMEREDMKNQTCWIFTAARKRTSVWMHSSRFPFAHSCTLATEAPSAHSGSINIHTQTQTPTLIAPDVYPNLKRVGCRANVLHVKAVNISSTSECAPAAFFLPPTHTHTLAPHRRAGHICECVCVCAAGARLPSLRAACGGRAVKQVIIVSQMAYVRGKCARS